ncbi:MAG TPA: ATP-binding cassette domain-containing protein, partial [Candidatus Limnocylindrales bacterium]|nr:ATP-binding cassette domain-containing protein [Candidatus Limnocylindrales bacterium]
MSDSTRSVSLEVAGIRAGYDGVTVLKGLDFSVGNEIFAVLGANGAGKTTLLATLARLIPLMAGTITFQGEDVSALPPYETAGRGIGYVPQEKGTFPDLTVLENLSVGAMIGGRSRDERLAETQDHHPVGNLECLRGVLLGQDDGHAPGLVDLPDPVEEHVDVERGEAGGRLVEEQDPRVLHQRAPAGDHAGLTAAEGPRALGPLGPERREQVEDLGQALVTRAAADHGPHAQVLENREVGEGALLLRHVADAPAGRLVRWQG